MLGCDLASVVFLVSTRGQQWPHRDHQGTGILRDCQGNSSVILAMTLSHLHSRFPTCLVCLWEQMSIYLGTLELECFQDFLDLESTFDMRFDILLGLEIISLAQWEWAIQVPRGRVVVLFILTIEIHPQSQWLENSLSAFPSILSMYHYDGWLYFMMDVYIFYDG